MFVVDINGGIERLIQALIPYQIYKNMRKFPLIDWIKIVLTSMFIYKKEQSLSLLQATN